MEKCMFKKSIIGHLALMICLLSSGVIKNSTVFAGGTNGGGGNGTEALFKSKAIELSRHIMNFEEESQDALTFDPFLLYATLNDPTGFYVLCATDKELEHIRKENKMAYVFNEKPGTVFLNCFDYSDKDWERRLDWSQDENAIFILHESLRILDAPGENNYGHSKNYTKALIKENKINTDRIFKAAYSETPARGCRLGIRKDSVYLYVDNKVFFSGGPYEFSGTTEKISQIMHSSTKGGKIAYQELVKALKTTNCGK
jgi:hypothetical protein